MQRNEALLYGKNIMDITREIILKLILLLINHIQEDSENVLIHP